MKRQEYESPTMQVVKLQIAVQLLNGSSFGATRGNGYGTANDGVNELTNGTWVWE